MSPARRLRRARQPRRPRPWIPLALAAVSVAALGVFMSVGAEEGETSFVPPTKKEREQAIGSTEGLSAPLRRAFAPGGDFRPIPEPGRHDWLANFREPGRTFAQYVASGPNRPDAKRKTIYLQPLGGFDTDAAPSLEVLRRFAGAFFGMEVKAAPPIAIAKIQARRRTNRYTGKPQIRSDDVLKALGAKLPPDAYCVLGTTMEDLYPDEKWNFVFGQASLRERVGVYSFVRYDPRFFGQKAPEDVAKLVLRRSIKVLAHEAGHMFGMHHCIHFLCLMNGSNHMAESDSRPLHLCPVCLRKLHHAVEFDLAARYEKLAAFCRDAGIDDEAEWYAKRLAHVRGDR